MNIFFILSLMAAPHPSSALQHQQSTAQVLSNQERTWPSRQGNCLPTIIGGSPSLSAAEEACKNNPTCQGVYASGNGHFATRYCSSDDAQKGWCIEESDMEGQICNTQQGGTTYWKPAEPTAEPTSEPTTDPTADPTESPTSAPTEAPTADPTSEPTADPTTDPTASPAPVSPSPCEANMGTCTVVEDPHIGVFDGAQVSLYGFRKAASVDKWLVKSKSVSIQARFAADLLEGKQEFVRWIAVGGAFLRGNVIIVGSLEDNINWNGNPILEQNGPGSDSYAFTEGDISVNVTRSDHSWNVANLCEENRGIDMKFPLGISLIVNRLHHHLDVAIMMPPQEGQDGLCGNFNGDAADDTWEFSSKRLDPNVPPQDSLFAGVMSA